MQEQHTPNAGNKIPNPWRLIWAQPERALEFVLRYQPEEYLHRLYMAWGVATMLVLRLPDWMTARPDPIGVMIQILLVAPVMGITLGYFLSTMLSTAAQWLGAEANKKVVRAVVAWTHIPFLLALGTFLIIYIALSFTLPPAVRHTIWVTNTPQGWIAISTAILIALYGVWIRVRSLAYIYGLPLSKALLVWGLGALMCYGPVALMSIVYWFLYYATIIRPGT